MPINTNPSVSGNNPPLDYLTLWLNYENKLDVLRGHFLTIAGLLFTLQAGVFVLMLDKMFDPGRTSMSYVLIDIIIDLLYLSA